MGLGVASHVTDLAKKRLTHAQCECHVRSALSGELFRAHEHLALVYLKINHDAALPVTHSV